MSRTGSEPGPAAPRKRGWLLLLAALIACAAGALYLWKWTSGLRGTELLGFTTIYISAPLGVSLLLMFAYFQRGKKRG